MTTRALSSSVSPNKLAVSATALAVVGSAGVGLVLSFDTGALLSLSFLVGLVSLMLSGAWANARLSGSR